MFSDTASVLDTPVAESLPQGKESYTPKVRNRKVPTFFVKNLHDPIMFTLKTNDSHIVEKNTFSGLKKDQI